MQSNRKVTLKIPLQFESIGGTFGESLMYPRFLCAGEVSGQGEMSHEFSLSKKRSPDLLSGCVRDGILFVFSDPVRSRHGSVYIYEPLCGGADRLKLRHVAVDRKRRDAGDRICLQTLADRVRYPL